MEGVFSEEFNKMVLIFGQIKEGFKIWRKGWLSFILAVILLSIVFIVILIPALVGVATIASFIEGDIIFTGVIIGYAVISLAMMFNFVVIGTMCGLGKELIEIEDTRAENTLHYIKNYGLRFAAIGLIIATVVFGPFIVIGLVLSFLNILPGASLDLATGIVLGILIFLIAFFLFAPFTLSIPACLIEDIGPIESIKTSFQAFRKNPKTISVLLALFIIIFVALLAFPVIGFIIGLVQTPFAVILASVLGTFAVIAFFVSLFVILPVMCITFTKLYYDYKIPRKEEVSEEESPISLF